MQLCNTMFVNILLGFLKKNTRIFNKLVQEKDNTYLTTLSSILAISLENK